MNEAKIKQLSLSKQYLRILESMNKTPPKLMPRQKGKLMKRVHALRGKFKGKGLMKAFMVDERARKESLVRIYLVV